MKKFTIRMGSSCGYGSSLEREVIGDFHKVHGGTGALSVFRDRSEVLLVVGGEWLEVNITELPKEEMSEEKEAEKVIPFVTEASRLDVDIESEILHAELKHADVFDAFQKSGRELAEGIGDGAVAKNIMKMIRKKWEDRSDI